MITLKSEHEIELMRRAGKITAAARALAREMVKPGVTTQQIDKAVYHFIKSQGALPIRQQEEVLLRRKYEEVASRVPAGD